MWDMLGPTSDAGNGREEGLKKCWKSILKHDVDVKRFHNNSGSAWDIVDSVVTKKSDQKAGLSNSKKKGFRSLMISILVLRYFKLVT